MGRKYGLSACVVLVGCTGYLVEPAQSSFALAIDGAVQPPVPPMESPAEPVVEATSARHDAEVGVMALDLRIAHGGQLADYLTDGAGRALYMFVDDVPDRDEAACAGDCARSFPPFDLAIGPDEPALFEAGIDAREISRMHRQDGAWQVRYKGHPLYYQAGALPGDVSADGLDGRWFAARDYFAFLSTTASFEPAGEGGTQRLFLTDGFGRTLYVCLDDAPPAGPLGPTSACSGTCLANRPPFSASASLRTTRLPSSLDPFSLGAFVRSDGIVQLTYRGWPLYYFRGDAVTGDTSGHNQGAWRAIDPTAFGEGETF